MAQIFGLLLVVGLAIVALKLAVGMALILGLIFRTKGTLALIVLLGAWALFKAYPVAGLTLAGAVAVYTFLKLGKSPDEPPTEAPQPLPDEPS